MSELRFLAIGILLLGCAFVAMPLDDSVARFFEGESQLPGDIRRFIRLCEVFAHGLGVTMILITALVLDWANRRRIIWAGISAAACGGIANISKMIIERSRPHAIDLASTSASESFGLWFPGFQEGPWTHAMQSFPSAHTATGVGFAIGLAYAYPHARYWFAVLAVLAGLQRLECEAHFLSDVLAGAGVAFLIATIVTALGRRIGPWDMEDLERWAE